MYWGWLYPLGWQGLCRCTPGSRKEQKAEQPPVLYFWPRSPCVAQLLQSPFVPCTITKVSGATVPQCSEENSLPHLPCQKHLTFEGEKKWKHHKAFTQSDQTTFKSFQPKPFYDFMTHEIKSMKLQLQATSTFLTDSLILFFFKLTFLFSLQSQIPVWKCSIIEKNFGATVSIS